MTTKQIIEIIGHLRAMKFIVYNNLPMNDLLYPQYPRNYEALKKMLEEYEYMLYEKEWVEWEKNGF